jgi:hypothetical protein
LVLVLVLVPFLAYAPQLLQVKNGILWHATWPYLARS